MQDLQESEDGVVQVEQWVSFTDVNGSVVHGDYAERWIHNGERWLAIVIVEDGDETRVVLVDPSLLRIEQAVTE